MTEFEHSYLVHIAPSTHTIEGCIVIPVKCKDIAGHIRPCKLLARARTY